MISRLASVNLFTIVWIVNEEITINYDQQISKCKSFHYCVDC